MSHGRQPLSQWARVCYFVIQLTGWLFLPLFLLFLFALLSSLLLIWLGRPLVQVILMDFNLPFGPEQQGLYNQICVLIGLASIIYFWRNIWEEFGEYRRRIFQILGTEFDPTNPPFPWHHCIGAPFAAYLLCLAFLNVTQFPLSFEKTFTIRIDSVGDDNARYTIAKGHALIVNNNPVKLPIPVTIDASWGWCQSKNGTDFLRNNSWVEGDFLTLGVGQQVILSCTRQLHSVWILDTAWFCDWPCSDLKN
jgi:hypothetical protein